MSWATGLIFATTGCLTSDYIRVEKQQNINQTYNSQIMFYNKNKEYLGAYYNGGLSKTTGNEIKNFTIPNNEEIYYMRLSYRTSANPNINLLTANIQVEINTATPYVPHAEQNLPFTLEEGERMYQGSSLEDDGKHHIRKQIVLDGTENWSIATDYGFGTEYTQESGYIAFTVELQHSLGLKSTTDLGNALSNIAICKKWGTLQGIPQNGFCIIRYDISQTKLWVAVPRTVASTVVDFKAFLQNQNMIIEDEIDESVYQSNIIPYNSTQQTQYETIKNAYTYADETNVSSESDELPPILEVQYWLKDSSEIETQESIEENNLSFTPIENEDEITNEINIINEDDIIESEVIPYEEDN